MPFRRNARRYGGMRPVINSTKNVVDNIDVSTGGANIVTNIAEAQDTPLATVDDNVSIGCKIFRVFMELSINGTAGTGVNNAIRFYIIKNPGNNLTLPNPGTTGTSNEKKFVVFEGMFNLGATADGASTQNMKRWIKLPKVYHRMGTDDRWQFVVRTEGAATANYCTKFIYKWYR